MKQKIRRERERERTKHSYISQITNSTKRSTEQKIHHLNKTTTTASNHIRNAHKHSKSIVMNIGIGYGSALAYKISQNDHEIKGIRGFFYQ